MRPDRSFDVVLLDGGTARLRVAEPADAARIRAFHGRLSDETVYLRYFSAMRELPRRLVERFTRADPTTSLNLLALVSDQLVALAGYTRYAGSDDAEVAFVVDDAHHGRGLATLLLEHLAALARAHGIRRFVAETLPHNRKMLRVFRDAGFPMQRERRDGVVHLAFPLDATAELEAATARRQHRAEARSVERLLEPASIAVVAAPAHAGDAAARRVLERLQAGGFTGLLHWVDPSGAAVGGLKPYPRLEDVADDVDLVLTEAPVHEAAGLLEPCVERGAHGIVLLARPGDGPDRGPHAAADRELAERARANGLRLVGPGSLGLANTAPGVSMDATLVPGPKQPGPAGVLLGRGAPGLALLERMTRARLGVSSWISLGRRADVSANDVLHYWCEDAATAVVLLDEEPHGNPRKLPRVARRLAHAKPVLVAGPDPARSAPGGPAAGGARALLEATGILRAQGLDAALEAARVLAADAAGGRSTAGEWSAGEAASQEARSLVEAYRAWRARPEGRAPALAGVDRARADRAVGAAFRRLGSGGGELVADELATLLSSYGISLSSATGAEPAEPGPGDSGSRRPALQLELAHDPLAGPRIRLLPAGASRVLPLSDLDARALAAEALGPDAGGAAPVADLVLRAARLAEETPEVVRLELGPIRTGDAHAGVRRARIVLAPFPAARADPDRLARAGGLASPT